MKKGLSCIVIFVFAIILTGCGKKTLTCSGDITEGGVTAAVKVTGNFESDKLVNQTIEMEFDLTSYLQYADIDTFYDSFKEQYSTFDEYEGISTSVSKGDSSIIVTMAIDLKKVDEETYKKLDIGSGSIEVSAKAYQDEFIDMGLNCK